jgi:hypothetical protein
MFVLPFIVSIGFMGLGLVLAYFGVFKNSTEVTYSSSSTSGSPPSNTEDFSNSNKIISYDSVDLNGVKKKMNISVRSEFDDRMNAANLLADINNEVVRLVHYLKTDFTKNYINSGQLNRRDHYYNTNSSNGAVSGLRRDTELSKSDIIKVIKNLDRYGSNTIEENYPSEKSTSVTIDKGHKMKFCVRSMKTGELVDKNTMTFVFLHELSHIGCTSTSAQSHNKEFWTTFHFILLIACELNIYHPINYSKSPVYYCSMNITYSPLYDDK